VLLLRQAAPVSDRVQPWLGPGAPASDQEPERLRQEEALVWDRQAPLLLEPEFRDPLEAARRSAPSGRRSGKRRTR